MSTGRSLQSLCVEDVDPEFICVICSDVMVQPHQCKDGHMYCLECINSWLATHETCPSCRQSLKSTDLAKVRVVENVLGKLLVRCRHSIGDTDTSADKPPAKRAKKAKKAVVKNEPRCEWQGALSTIDHHVEHDCGFTMVACLNAAKGCTYLVQRQHLALHLETCPFECVVCETCDQPGICRGEMAAHLAVCSMVVVSCVNECGANHLRQETDAHEAVCPQAVVTCPFASHGCDVTGALRRYDYDRHQVEAATKHSEMVALKVAGLEVELTSLKKKVEHVGEVSVKWNVDLNKMRASSTESEQSKIFSMFVPGAGEYQCYLSMSISDDECLGLFLKVREGPIFPLIIGLAKFSCGERTKMFKDVMDAPQGRGYSNFMTYAQAEAAKDVEGCLLITAKIQLKCESALSI